MRNNLASIVALLMGFTAFVACPGCPDKGSTTAPPAPPPSAGTSSSGTPAAPAPPPSEPATPQATGAYGTCTIHGRVTAAGKTPPPPVKVDKDVPVCGETHDPQSLVVDADGGLANCVVYLKDEPAPKDWNKAGDYTIDQKTCHYTPRVLIVPLGESVTFTSGDDVLHNVNAGAGFNDAVSKGDKKKMACAKAGFVPLKCNVHLFMSGLLVVADNPWYALTDAHGNFKLERVPAGKHRLIAQHEILGKLKSVEVELKDGEDKAADLQY